MSDDLHRLLGGLGGLAAQQGLSGLAQSAPPDFMPNYSAAQMAMEQQRLHQRMHEAEMQARAYRGYDPVVPSVPRERAKKTVSKTLRDELQNETSEWLKDTIEI